MTKGSVIRRPWLAGLGTVAAVLVAPESASAQDPDQDRFFVFQPADDKDVTDYSGTLTSSSFFYGEYASGDDPLIVPDPAAVVAIPAEVDSPRSRLFTDLRGRLDARHISGGKWDMRGDARVRLTSSELIQSGQFGDNEYDLRELFFGRNGDATDVYVGRQFIPELAAIKIDGIKIDYEKNASWHYLGFAGLYPTRGSRSIDSDYPRSIPAPGAEPGPRVLPYTSGLGASYRFDRLYGSFGVVGIYAPYEDQQGNANERRVFVTSTGYWRESSEIDVYHFLVADLDGAAGRALTNLTLGANYAPVFNVRINAQITHIDTETLNVQAQTRLENPAAPAGQTLNVVLNNVEVARLSQDEARLSLSSSFAKSRFEVSAIGSVRRRPEVVLTRDTNMDPITLDKAQAADITLSAVDRKSFKDLRLGLSYSRAFGLGEQNLNRSNFQVVHLNGLRDVLGGLGSVEGSVTYVSSEDDNDDMACASSLEPLACYGTSTASTLTLGLMGTYRFKPDWLGILSTTLGTQAINVENVAQERLDLPRIMTASVFLRLAYRF